MLLLGSAGTALAGVHVALTPGNPVIQPGAEFDLRIEVPIAGAPFNGYTAVVDYDPAALTFIERLPSIQEGSSMRNACGSTFHNFSATTGRLSISDVLMCAGLSLTGPAELYVLHFRASSQLQLTAVTFHSIQFANGGPLVPVESIANSTVRIGSATDTRSLETVGALADLEVFPNPVGVARTITVQWRGAGDAAVALHDVRGRIVAYAERTPAGRATHSIAWNLAASLPGPLPSGVYFITVRTPAESLTRRIALLK